MPKQSYILVLQDGTLTDEDRAAIQEVKTQTGATSARFANGNLAKPNDYPDAIATVDLGGFIEIPPEEQDRLTQEAEAEAKAAAAKKAAASKKAAAKKTAAKKPTQQEK
jgi:hypothetical protein